MFLAKMKTNYNYYKFVPVKEYLMCNSKLITLEICKGSGQLKAWFTEVSQEGTKRKDIDLLFEENLNNFKYLSNTHT